MSLAIGSRIGAYEIITAIGAGGMGEVYRARDTRLNREVAIKVLPAAFVQDHERVARFKRPPLRVRESRRCWDDSATRAPEPHA